METLLYLLYQAAGLAPMIPLDEQLRPTWLFGKTVHEGCDRAGYYEQADFAHEYGSPKCIVKLGCWGPVVQCNVGKRGWMAGIGGCPNVGGICIGCTMPGFPDKFMPFMDEPPGANSPRRPSPSMAARFAAASIYPGVPQQGAASAGPVAELTAATIALRVLEYDLLFPYSNCSAGHPYQVGPRTRPKEGAAPTRVRSGKVGYWIGRKKDDAKWAGRNAGCAEIRHRK